MKISADLGKSWNTAQLPTITGDRVRKGIKVLKVLIGISIAMKMYSLSYLQIRYSKLQLCEKKNCDKEKLWLLDTTVFEKLTKSLTFQIMFYFFGVRIMYS